MLCCEPKFPAEVWNEQLIVAFKMYELSWKDCKKEVSLDELLSNLLQRPAPVTLGTNKVASMLYALERTLSTAANNI